MKGHCAKCGCTERTPCMADRLPCGWIDERMDFCSACAEKLLGSPPKIESFADVELWLRMMRMSTFQTRQFMTELLAEQLEGFDPTAIQEVEGPKLILPL